MFYRLHQNNSGGYHVTDDNLCANLIIEANSEEEALSKAETLGCYWDGVDKGIYCPCFGDRWSQYTDEINIDTVHEVRVYGPHNNDTMHKWMAQYGKYKRETVPHYNENGRVLSCYRGKIKFRNIEEYAQFHANEYGGWTSPDVRIFYADGTVKEFCKESKE